jgi:hypothetical protein
MILSRRARLVALSLAGAGLSLQAASPGVVAAAPGAPSGTTSSAGAAPPAGAAPSWKDASPEARAEAQELFRRATDESENGSYEGAIDALTQAARVYPHPKILAALAATWEQVGRPDRALPVYERILADEHAPPSIREEVARLASRARGKLGTLHIKVPLNPVLLTLDGEPISPGTLRLLPGKHQLHARFPDREDTSRSLELAAGQELSLQLDPGAMPMPCLSPPPPPPPPPVHGGGCGCGTPGAPG